MRLLTASVRLVLFAMLPLTALGMVVRFPLVEVLFGYGQFDARAVALTADALFYFLLGLAAHSLIAILARAFYAGRDTRTPVAAAILAVAINVTLAFALVDPMGIGGLALAIAFGAWAEALVLLEILRRRYPAFDIPAIVRAFLEATGASVLAGIAALATLWALQAIAPTPGKLIYLIELVVPSVVGGLAFLAAAVALRIPELPTIVEVVSDLLHRPPRPRTS
jgi:putative peptidoglycan lipid II flippase